MYRIENAIRRGFRQGSGRVCRRLAPGLVLVALLASSVALAAPPRVIAFGDSLVAGFGLAPEDALVPRLEAWLERRGVEVDLVNAGVSGDTTATGRARLAWSVGADADAVILVLGANDMLRGLDPAETRRNLEAMLVELARRDIPVLLVGMRAAANLGAEYVAAFDGIYPALASRHGVPLYPFLLEGVALVPSLNQSDGIHPNAAGVREIVDRFGPAVAVFLAGLPGADP